jgi:hypothetical protein|tara:strand:- start:2395 stop:2661 length:267 start_codon:yes stop_codon:yes gene_type:complete
MDEMEIIIWTDGSKPERSCKEDNPSDKQSIERVYDGSINKREDANNKLNERELVKQVCANPFFTNDSYHDIIEKQEQFLIPKNSNYGD